MIYFCSYVRMKAYKHFIVKDSAIEWGGRNVQSYFVGENLVYVIKLLFEEDFMD